MKKIIISLLLIFSLLLLSGCSLTGGNGGITGDPSDSNHEKHSDENNDGRCDFCAVSVITVFDFYAINDLHGKFSDTDSQPGVDELTTYLKDAKAGNENTVILSSGDMWQGTAESNLTGGLILTEWMNELGFASMTMGNHEYDWGEDFIENNDMYASFPFLAINVFDRETNERVSYCDASAVLDFDGIQVGIIGAIGDTYSSISSDMVEDVYFKTGRELTELIKAESDRLRLSGVDIIIYSLHDGYDRNKSTTTNVTANDISSYYDIELSRGGYVDLVFEAHTHKSYVLKDSYGVYHLQGGGENKSISHVELNYNFANLTTSVARARTIQNSVYSERLADDIVSELSNKYSELLAKGEEVLGNNPYKLSSNEIENTVAKLYMEAGISKWGDEYDIVLGGGYIGVRSPYNLYAGEVKYADVYSLLPFDNAIVLCSIKGSDLKKRFTETDNSDYHIRYTEYGDGIKNNIEEDKTYYIVTDTYSSLYTPNRLTVVDTYDSTTFARDLFAEYIKSGGLAE